MEALQTTHEGSRNIIRSQRVHDPPIVFQKNYHYLREMETIVAHDHLFRLKTVQDGTVLVEETTNATAQCLALYEIQTFKAMVCAACRRLPRKRGGVMP